MITPAHSSRPPRTHGRQPAAPTLTPRPPMDRNGQHPPVPAFTTRQPGTAADGRPAVDAGGTIWRLRSLVAMGHDATRIAHALGLAPRTARRLISGDTATMSPGLRDLACQLWEAWWDKHPPEDTPARRRAASAARNTAQRRRWCTPLALDEDCLDQPGYRPYSIWRPAASTGVATDFRPAADTGVATNFRPAAGTGVTTDLRPASQASAVGASAAAGVASVPNPAGPPRSPGRAANDTRSGNRQLRPQRPPLTRPAPPQRNGGAA